MCRDLIDASNLSSVNDGCARSLRASIQDWQPKFGAWRVHGKLDCRASVLAWYIDAE
jgi:hypothetical protein